MVNKAGSSRTRFTVTVELTSLPVTVRVMRLLTWNIVSRPSYSSKRETKLYMLQNGIRTLPLYHPYVNASRILRM